MKKKKTDPNEGITWPPTYAKDVPDNKPVSHHHQPKSPGSDDHHALDEAREKDNKRVWDEKNKRNLPPKKLK